MCGRACVSLALSICKGCIDWPKDISSNVLADEEWEGGGEVGGGDGFHLASELLGRTSICQRFPGTGRGQEWVGAGIIKIATASSSQHTLAQLEHVVVYTVGGRELMHLRV